MSMLLPSLDPSSVPNAAVNFAYAGLVGAGIGYSMGYPCLGAKVGLLGYGGIVGYNKLKDYNTQTGFEPPVAGTVDLGKKLSDISIGLWEEVEKNAPPGPLTDLRAINPNKPAKPIGKGEDLLWNHQGYSGGPPKDVAKQLQDASLGMWAEVEKNAVRSSSRN